MSGLLDFFSHEAGQRRTRARDEAINDILRTFLGPTGIPERLGLFAELNPVQDIYQAGANMRDGDYAGAAVNTASALAPVAAWKLAGSPVDEVAGALTDTLTGVGMKAQGAMDAGQAFAADEAGHLDNPFKRDYVWPTQTDAASGIRAYDLPAGSRPEYLGAAPDRSDITYLRYNPKKLPPRMQGSMDAMRDINNPARVSLEQMADRGKQLGGDDWYNTEELRDWFVNAYGDAEGDKQWREFMYLMGTTSPGSNVMANIGNASAVRQRLASDPQYLDELMGVEKLADASPLAKGRPKGYGHKTANLQELATARHAQGAWNATPQPDVSAAKGNWVQNPKPKGFANSLLGNRRNMAADLHFTRYMGMASQDPRWFETGKDVGEDFVRDLLAKNPAAAEFVGRRTFKGADGVEKSIPTFNAKAAVASGKVKFDEVAHYAPIWAQKPNDNEYAAFEQLINEIAEKRGETPAQLQANIWMGAADQTGVAESSQGTFMELLRRRAEKTGSKTGRTGPEVIDDFIRNYGLLGVAAGGLAGTGLLSLNNEERMNGT